MDRSGAGPAPRARHGYPTTFSAELVRHCEEGCVPPEVFEDARALVCGERRRRYLRINPRGEARVVDAGVEGVLRLQQLRLSQAAQTDADMSRVLTPEEEAVAAAASQADKQACSATEPASRLTRRRQVCAAVPRTTVLRLGLAALTGLPLASVEAVAWLPCGVMALPWSYPMGSSPLFRDGTLLAMDAASMAAVVALRPRRGDRVLDLCCAPGMKLGLVADAVSAGLAVGVDVSLPRLFMTRSTLKKQQQRPPQQPLPERGGDENASSSSSSSSSSHHIPPHVCVFSGDGRTFSMDRATAALDLGSASAAAVESGTGLTAVERRRLRHQGGALSAATPGSKRGRPPSDAATASATLSVVYAPACSRTVLAAWKREEEARSLSACPDPRAAPPPLLFDRVLVDAECSHDGSVAHMQLGDVDECDAEEESTAPASIRKGRGLDNRYRMHHLNISDAGHRIAPASSQPSADTADPIALPLFALQSALLDNGYRQLRPGGTLVYATCSYSYLQNEHVVRRFLERVNAGSGGDGGHCGPDGCVATLVPAFAYSHESTAAAAAAAAAAGDSSNGDGGEVAACVRLDSEAQRAQLQGLLDAHAMDYGTVQEGHARYARTAPTGDTASVALGSRFWPRTFETSFLYIAKVWKKPTRAAASTGAVEERHG
ncbi:NOL1/NOP2/sun family [Novymonas esmeraldas]|uniref:NOL1/NOP2/sun family n=1 Tax=Novymonas esmeraldas TaxID=1808958 RepID=A0AAW0F307_9TRYP